MEVFFDIIRSGNLKIELSIRQHGGCYVIFTVQDETDRRILRAPVMDNGKIKIYATPQEALKDVQNKLTALSSEISDVP